MPDPIDPADDAFMEASAALLGLTLTAAQKPAIADNLALLRGHVQNLFGFVLPDREEPAPVFHP